MSCSAGLPTQDPTLSSSVRPASAVSTGLLQAVREGNVGVANALGQRRGGSAVAAAVPGRCCTAPARRDTRTGIDRHLVVRRSRSPGRGARRSAHPSSSTTRIRSPPATLGVRRRAVGLRHDGLAGSDDGSAAPVRGAAEDRVRQHAGGGRRRTAAAAVRRSVCRPCDSATRRSCLPGGHGRHVAPGQLVINSSDAFGKDVWVLTDPAVQASDDRVRCHCPTRPATADRPSRLVADPFGRGAVLARTQCRAGRSSSTHGATDHRPHG